MKIKQVETKPIRTNALYIQKLLSQLGINIQSIYCSWGGDVPPVHPPQLSVGLSILW